MLCLAHQEDSVPPQPQHLNGSNGFQINGMSVTTQALHPVQQAMSMAMALMTF